MTEYSDLHAVKDGTVIGKPAMNLRQCFTGILALLVFTCGQAVAEGKDKEASGSGKPLWEIGIGGFAGYIPHYPAAGQNSMRYFAAPIPIYRGKILRVGEENRGAVSGRFINKKRYEFDITLSAAFPVDSGNNNAREGMPDLDYLFGIGPQLIFKLIDEPGDRKLNLNLQARAVYSTDFSSVNSQGYVFNPKLRYSRENLTDLDLKFFASTGPVFATEDLMDYFYGVQPEFVTPKRPAFDADAGYLGSNLTFAVSKRFNKRFRLWAGTRLGVHHGATNDDSPLFKDNINGSVFMAFFWSIFQSEKTER